MRESRRVVRLSRVDQERLDRGGIASPEEAVHINDAPPIEPVFPVPAEPGESVDGEGEASDPKPRRSFSPHERDILAEVPPHFGKI